MLKKGDKYVISGIGEFDLAEIVEDMQDEVGFVLHVEGAGRSIVFLKNDFVEKFHPGDKVGVAGCTLCYYWGGSSKIKLDNEFRFEVDNDSSVSPIPPVRYITISSNEIEKIVGEVEAAKRYKRRIKIEVTPL